MKENLNFKKHDNASFKTKRLNKKSFNGITLIALVVTIVVLLILAGITIATVFSDNGILKTAQDAAEKARIAEARTKVDLAMADWQVVKHTENKTFESYLKEVFGEANVTANGDRFDVKVDGYIFTVSPDGNVELASGTGGEDTPVEIASLKDGFAEKNTLAKDTQGNIVTVPKGFKIATDSGATVQDGIVIEDEIGNQFVWIPVDGTSLKYEKHTYANASASDTSGSTADTGNGGWRTYHYRSYNDWEDYGGDSISVKKYKGFYLARFEAGIREASTGTTDYTYTSYTSNSTQNNIDNKKPLSKKNCEAWNGINAVNAKKVAEKMYEGNTAVKSQLVDARAWDTVTQWLSNSGHNVTDGTSWGNYYNNEFPVTGFYANHTYGSSWTVSSNWTYGNNFSKPASNGTNRYELLTGAVERNKANNIYDFSGNMYEWTTETRTYYTVVRGGSFYSKAYDPASYRRGNIASNVTNPDVGFRVVLYLKHDGQQEVTNITINPNSIEIKQGETKALSITTEPSGANIEELEYTSSDTTGKITVNSEGKVTVASDAPIGTTATITVKGKLSGKTATCTITVKAATLPIGEYVEYDVAYTDMYVADIDTVTEGNQGFTKANGWRILDVGSKNADGSYSGAKIVSTGVPALLRYYYNMGQDNNTISESNKPNWWGTPEQVTTRYGQTYADKGYIYNSDSAISGYPNYYAATGLEKNFALIPFEQKTSGLGYNKGGYSSISKQGTPETGDITGEIFKIDGKAGEVHNLTLAELNTAINKINGNNSRGETSTSSISSSCDLFYLRSLTAFNYSSASPYYWLAFPFTGNSSSLRGVYSGGSFNTYKDHTLGARPVVSLTSDIYKDGNIWKIK